MNMHIYIYYATYYASVLSLCTWFSAAAATASRARTRLPKPIVSPPISPSLPPTYAMYEPHLVDFANQHSHDNEGMSLLEELDKIAPIKRFDAFPKVRLLFLVPAGKR